jgi:hypothetical protein
VPAPPPGTTSSTIEVAKDRVTDPEMKRRLLEEPAGFVRKFVIQLFTFWYLVETRLKSLVVGSIALGMLTLAAIGALRAHRSGGVVWPVVFVLLYFNAFYAAFLSLARYSMPLFPTLAVLASAGLIRAFDLLVQHRRRAAGASLQPVLTQPRSDAEACRALPRDPAGAKLARRF